MKQDIQKKKCQQQQQKPQELIIESFGQPKKQDQQQGDKKIAKTKDVPVEIYLPFMSQIEQKQQQLNSAKEKLNEQLVQSQQQNTKKQNPKLGYERAEKIRSALERELGLNEFLTIYNTFKSLREKNSLEDIAKQYGPNYTELIPNMQQELIQAFLPSLFILLEFDLDE
ncbi:unnamed protein product (macronuclear) [Paramecium tetraurelia]|uniref:Uncharacterized protein n=1 Tax=Paramecium tetraurelia TaxID=5888 RepID=A0CY05_PARTE|nr:uncharacterized protein GSPATT00011304001 [Paramecium tetraurelia]CAK75672.1 unnamed protein product [Paramecium tetraurelia]|eukprot:XP_001443069.1 hypothetical protein (macronuclear) [Paramecium tetraurelia strain d4-2]